MTVTSSYSVTPLTTCFRHADGTRQIILCDRPKGPEGTLGYIVGGSFCAPGGEWIRTSEHPQEYEDWQDEHNGDAPEQDEPADQFLHDGEADGDALASCGFGTDEDYGGGYDRDE